MAENRRARVNMADVARESGVSLSTVSIVFSDKPGLPSETRLRVLDAARRLGYNPRRYTSANQIGPLRTVGLVMRSTKSDEIPRSDHFYSHVVAGIESACRQNNLNLLYATINVDLELRPVELPGLVKNGGADGLLLVGVRVDDKLRRTLDQCAVPVILVDSYQEKDEHTFDQVLSDNDQGAYQATQYLIGKGHRKIGFIGGSADTYPSFELRRKGFTRALRDHQIDEPFFADCHSDRDEAIEAARKLLSYHPEVTALVGVNDYIAIAAMHVAVELSRRVGGDLAIIGFDDILLSESVIPPLTTMQVDKIAMGRMAVNLLMNRSEQPNSAHATLILHPRLIERNSVMAVTASTPLSVEGQSVRD